MEPNMDRYDRVSAAYGSLAENINAYFEQLVSKVVSGQSDDLWGDFFTLCQIKQRVMACGVFSMSFVFNSVCDSYKRGEFASFNQNVLWFSFHVSHLARLFKGTIKESGVVDYDTVSALFSGNRPEVVEAFKRMQSEKDFQEIDLNELFN